jgi:capsular exopolysaccharide synthesis family protein
MALTLSLLGAGTVGAATWVITDWLLPAQYSSSALLRVPSTPPRIVFNTLDAQQGEYFLRTQLVLLKSPFVFNAALRTVGSKPCLASKEDPIRWLTERVSVGYMQGSEMLRIEMTGDNPTDVAEIVNAIKKAYMQEVVGEVQKKRMDRLHLLEQTYSDAEAKVKSKREQLKKIVEMTKTSDPQALTLRERIEVEEYGVRRQEQTRLQIELLRLQAQVTVQTAKNKATAEIEIPESLIDQAVELDPTAQQLKSKVYRIQERLNAMRAAAKDPAKVPGIASLERELAGIEQELKARREEIRPLAKANIVQKLRGDAEVALNEINERFTQLKEQERILNAELERYAAMADKTGTASAELEFVRYEIARADQTASQIANELEGLRVEIRSPSRVEDFQDAMPAKSKDGSRRKKLTILATMAAFALVLFGIAFLESRVQRLSTADEVRTRLGMRVVGALPHIPDETSSRWLAKNKREHILSFFAESVDSIRTLLLRESRLGSLKVIMVTSATGGEGKTTLSSHLATSLARGGRRTLLIDSDMRRPTTHTLFDLPLGPGFSDLARGEIDADELIQSTSQENLWVMTAGNGDLRGALKGLAAVSAEKMVKGLAEEYDFVIIDSPPVLPVADSLVIGQWVDGVIFSLLHDASRLPNVRAACQRVEMAGIRILGAVVGKARGNSLGYGYAYGYGYGYQAATPNLGEPDDSVKL